MKAFLKNTVLGLLLLGLLLNPAFFSSIQTKKAEAQMAVWVTTAPTLETLLGTIATNTTIKNAQDLREWGNSFLLEALKKRLLDAMVDDIITWVQGGGEPRFITNWNAYLDEVVGVAIGDFAQEIGLGFLCQPFSAQLQIALNPVNRFREAVSCTLDDIVGNIENFYNDFANGGWIAYQSSLQLENNFYGTYFLGMEERNRRIARAEFEALEDARAGDGFLSQRDANGNIVTPGKTIGNLVSKAVGADIDFIVNADQLAEYVSAIADALINRLIREGVGGLRGLTTRSNPGRDFTRPPGSARCAGLSGELLQACQSYMSNHDDSLESFQAFVLAEARTAISKRQELIRELSSLKTLWQNHLDFLNSARVIRPSCVLNSELEDAQSALITMEVRVSSVEIEINSLNDFIEDLENAESFTQENVRSSPYLNTQTVQNEIDSITEDGGEYERLEDDLKDIELAVLRCSSAFGSGTRS